MLKRVILSAAFLLCLAAASFYFLAFAAPQGSAETERFIVPLGASLPQIAAKLEQEGFVKSAWAFGFASALRGGTEPGGYRLSKAMNAWQAAGVLAEEPYMVWVSIPEGLRKEQIAGILADKLGWSDAVRDRWITHYTATRYDYVEGVYFPDTYLIPRDEAPLAVAERLQAKFQEKFAPYSQEALRQNIKWDTLLKIASLVQREAAGREDMPLIAGIIWNRLLQGMKLEVDATLQYARGETEEGWWAPITPAEKKLDSPYNTYLHKGLPPHPIANPGLSAIEAVLHPEETECLFYIHGNDRQIRCAKTYAEHQANIELYLR